MESAGNPLRDSNVRRNPLGALVAAALLLNGLIKIDTADGEKLGCNFQILQCFIFRVAKIDGHWLLVLKTLSI